MRQGLVKEGKITHDCSHQECAGKGSGKHVLFLQKSPETSGSLRESVV